MKQLILLIATCSLFHRIKYAAVLKRKYAARLQQRFGMELTMGKLTIKGFRTFLISGLIVQTKGVRLTADTVTLRLNIFTVLRKRKKAIGVQVHMGIVSVQPITNSSTNPVKSSTDQEPLNPMQALERKWYALYKKFRRIIFSNASLKLVVKECRVAVPGYEAALIVRDFHFSIPVFSMETICIYRNRQQAFKLEGTIDPAVRRIDAIITAMPSEEHPVLHFERLTCSFTETQATDDEHFSARLNCEMQGIGINHPRIAQHVFAVPSAGLELHGELSRQSFIFSEESCGHINEIPFSFLFSHDASEPDRVKCIVMGELKLPVCAHCLLCSLMHH